MATSTLAAVPKAKPKSKLRWLQFRLRTLLVLMALCGVAVRWAGQPIIAARQQANAVAAIEAAGGHFYKCRGKPIVPGWMRRFFAPSACISVSHVEFPRHSGDAEMALLADLPHVINLMGCGSHTTDAGMTHISGLSELGWLNLSETQITDTGLRYLCGLSNLQDLNLTDTHITDAGVEQLKSLTGLKRLHLDGTKVSAEQVESLEKALPNCAISGP